MIETTLAIHPTRIKDFYSRAEASKTKVELKEVDSYGKLEVKVSCPNFAVYLLLWITQFPLPDGLKKASKTFLLISKKQTTQKGEKNENQTI
jgi:hypothetical protein